jgi:hypothetical protein
MEGTIHRNDSSFFYKMKCHVSRTFFFILLFILIPILCCIALLFILLVYNTIETADREVTTTSIMENYYKTDEFLQLRELRVDSQFLFHIKHCIVSAYGHPPSNDDLKMWYHNVLSDNKDACKFDFHDSTLSCFDPSHPYTDYVLSKANQVCKVNKLSQLQLPPGGED